MMDPKLGRKKVKEEKSFPASEQKMSDQERLIPLNR